MIDLWDPNRCNFEKAGAGLVHAASWSGDAPLERFPSDAVMHSMLEARLKDHPKVSLLISHKGGIGDTLMCSTVAHELRRRGVKDIWLETRWKQDFIGQSVFDGVLEESYESEMLVQALGGRIVYPEYAREVLGEDREIGPDGHVLRAMCHRSGIVGRVALRPYFETREEFSSGLPDSFIAIGVMGSPLIPTKNWFAERYHALAAELRRDFDLVQLGSSSDPPLAGALDLRGRTSIRQAASVLKHARCFIGQVGGLMHLARAVECPAVIIFGGREGVRQSAYSANVNLTGPVPCSPCWIIKKCPHEMACMDLIRPVDVLAGVRRILEQGRPLPSENAVIGE